LTKCFVRLKRNKLNANDNITRLLVTLRKQVVLVREVDAQWIPMKRLVVRLRRLNAQLNQEVKEDVQRVHQHLRYQKHLLVVNVDGDH
jgi:transposase